MRLRRFKLPPFSYSLRSLFVRKSSTILTVLGIGATVAVLAGVMALQQGFQRLYQDAGREEVAVFLSPGAGSEGESSFQRTRAQLLIKETPEIALDAGGRPLASGEQYLAIRLRKTDGGETNVPIRGVGPQSLVIAGDALEVIEGRPIKPGTDDIMVGVDLTRRIRGCAVGEVIRINVTPFRVVGVFTYDGPFRSEIWGDVDRMGQALQRAGYNRVVAQLKPGADLKALAVRIENDKRTQAKVMSERAYLSSQTRALSGVLIGLGAFLALVMGTAAVFTGTNAMLAALAAREHEIGVLLSIGFRPLPIFISFLLEAILLGLMGGAVGCLLALPLNGVRTGTTNFQTFTEVAFAFRVTGRVLLTSVIFAMLLGLLGGLVPAWRAARRRPVEALRR
ncbi:MAG: ABC transporter permease [Planctomycetota bacterium]|jgi:ABC-type lipoprotein release transport system permease subunit